MKTNIRTWNIYDEDTIYEIMRIYNNIFPNLEPLYKRMTENFNFTIGELQWEPKIRKALEEEGRPAFSYNLIRTLLNIIYGVEKDNRKIPKATPITGDDTNLANIVTEVLRYYLRKGNFEEAHKRVFLDAITSMLGVYHINWVYDDSEDETGRLSITAVDPREMAWEDNYNDPLWQDTSYLFRKYQLSLEEIINTFALKDSELFEAIQKEAKPFFQDDRDKGKWVSRKLKQLFEAVYETALSYGDNKFIQWFDTSTGKFDILEMHEKRLERRLVVRDIIRNQLIDITTAYNNQYQAVENKPFIGNNFNPEIINIIKENYSLQGDADVHLVSIRFITTVVPALNLKVNEQPYPFQSKYYNYIPMFCFNNHPSSYKAQSIIDDVKDPQRDFNKARSLILELLARYSNRGYIGDENAISGLEEDWTSNKLAPFKRVRSGYFGLIKQEEAFNISPELIRMPIETQQLIKVITNADDELRGVKSPGVTSGRHFIAKEERQAKSFTLVLENRDRSLKALSEMALGFIRHFVKTQTVIRITQEVDKDNPYRMQEVTLNKRVFENNNGQIVERVINDISAYEYDIEITDEPFSASAQESKYKKMSDIFNAVLAVNREKADAILPLIIQMAGTPDADKIISIWEQQKQTNPMQEQLAQIMQQLQMVIAKLGVEEKQAQIEGIKLDNLLKAKEVKQPDNENNITQLLNQRQGGLPQWISQK